jgi:hypothetical protein
MEPLFFLPRQSQIVDAARRFRESVLRQNLEEIRAANASLPKRQFVQFKIGRDSTNQDRTTST